MKRTPLRQKYGTSIINPRLCDRYNMIVEIEQRIFEEELVGFPVFMPHIHVCLDQSDNSEHSAYIRLDKAEYMSGFQSAKINSEQKETLIKILSSPWDRYVIQSRRTDETSVASGYQAAVDIWIDTYGDESMEKFQFNEAGFPVMPDYSFL
ncbi:MAG: hypothetical protein LUE14_00170 [Clostridiales bacterium]|nr:hypothetical protein [Clostridiales bacterium]